jgi:hypothetical protein
MSWNPHRETCAMTNFSWRSHGANRFCAVMKVRLRKNDGANALRHLFFKMAH